MSYIRKCTLELLAYYYSNNEFEDELTNLVQLLKEAESINILINLSKDKELINILDEIDSLVESKLVYQEQKETHSIFEEVVTNELATTFLYRLVHLS